MPSSAWSRAVVNTLPFTRRSGFSSRVSAAVVGILFLTALFAKAAEPASDSALRWDSPHASNPFLPGYYADPSLVEHEGHVYLYATLDPWGGKTLGCWETTDLKHWDYRTLNWPTKEACTSPTSGGAMVWAPSVVRAANGHFYMYVSVGNEVWVGTADHPLGPWKNALGNKPLITKDAKPGFHMIDAECFVDDNSQAYLYWGSGWDWKNGHCFAVKLGSDMCSFDGETRDVTPPKGHYFEGPFMLKHDGRYFLMYSDGKTISDTYCVHYAVGDSPFGPFTEAANSPILETHRDLNVISPGHHAVFKYQGKNYIVYHRHSVPYVQGKAYRQPCMDDLVFASDQIEKITPSHRGPAIIDRGVDADNVATPAAGATVTASSSASAFFAPERVVDNNYATRWQGAAKERGASLRLDLGKVRQLDRTELLLEYAWKSYPILLETSLDGATWTPALDAREKGIQGSPTHIPLHRDARYLRLSFGAEFAGTDASVWEWRVYPVK